MMVGSTLALILLCVALEGFFSGSEIALVSADRLRLRADAEAGSAGAALALKMLERPAYILGTCLIGTNVSTIGGATLAASLVTTQLGLPAFVTALFVVPLTITFGEMVPKAMFQHHAERIAPVVIFPLRVLSVVFTPFLWLIDALSRLLGGGLDETERAVTRQELRLLLEGARTEGMSEDNRRLIQRVFAFTEATVEDAMVPLIEVIALPHTATLGEAARRMAETSHSRLPIYRERVDQIVGVLLHQDVMESARWDAPVSSLMREPLFVPETKQGDDLLLEMRRKRQRMAVVVDEYGGAVGIITVEDLLEEIVGDIHDETEPETSLVRRSGAGEWTVSARAEREHLRPIGLLLPDGDYATIAGYVLEVLGRVPPSGESLRLGPWALTVSRATDRAIVELKVRRDR
jgi:CBS domain containing-hemolysin-like protein